MSSIDRRERVPHAGLANVTRDRLDVHRAQRNA